MADAEEEVVRVEQAGILVQIEIGAELDGVAVAFQPGDEGGVPVGEVDDAPGAVEADLVTSGFTAATGPVDGVVVEADGTFQTGPVGAVVGVPGEGGLLVEDAGAAAGDAGAYDEELAGVPFELLRAEQRRSSGAVRAAFDEFDQMDSRLPVLRYGKGERRPIPVVGLRSAPG